MKKRLLSNSLRSSLLKGGLIKSSIINFMLNGLLRLELTKQTKIMQAIIQIRAFPYADI